MSRTHFGQKEQILETALVGICLTALSDSEMPITKVPNTKHPDSVLSSADTSIKVTILPLTYAVYPWSEHCECALRNNLQFVDQWDQEIVQSLVYKIGDTENVHLQMFGLQRSYNSSLVRAWISKLK